MNPSTARLEYELAYRELRLMNPLTTMNHFRQQEVMIQMGRSVVKLYGQSGSKAILSFNDRNVIPHWDIMWLSNRLWWYAARKREYGWVRDNGL